jgi:hypothetical protein
MRRYLLFILLLLAGLSLKAQTPDVTGHYNKTDSLNRKRDSVTSKPFKPKIKAEKVYHPDSTHSPHTALMRTLMFPGLGQIYNRHGLWWRLPAIYGGMGALVYNIISNGRDYVGFLKESQWRAHGRQGPEPLPTYNGEDISGVLDQTIYDFKDNLRRNRDLSIFGLIGAWGLTAVDAYVEAKFMHSYTMDNDLSFKITPTLSSPPVYASNFNPTFTPALKITFVFR